MLCLLVLCAGENSHSALTLNQHLKDNLLLTMVSRFGFMSCTLRYSSSHHDLSDDDDDDDGDYMMRV